VAAVQRSTKSEPVEQTLTPNAHVPRHAPEQGAAEVQHDVQQSDVTGPQRDVVTEASMDSFPASDPPGWIPVKL